MGGSLWGPMGPQIFSREPRGATWAPVLFSALALGSFFSFWPQFFFWLVASCFIRGRTFGTVLSVTIDGTVGHH